MDGLFYRHIPREYNSELCVTGDFRNKERIILHNINDQINNNKPDLEKVLIECQIQNIKYNLFTVKDILNLPYSDDPMCDTNVKGCFAEYLARRKTKCFLKLFRPFGRTTGLFREDFDISNPEDYTVAENENYKLKIKRYPNLALIDLTENQYGRETELTDIDGFFSFKYFLKKHIIVVESKVSKLNQNLDSLLTNLFNPLKELYPKAEFSYFLYSNPNTMYKKKNRNLRMLREKPRKIFNKLIKNNINPLFCAFNISASEFDNIAKHLLDQYYFLTKDATITLNDKTIISKDSIEAYGGGRTPLIKLRKRPDGLWEEIPLTHRNKK